MKKTIIILTTVFGLILMIAIVCVAVSPNEPSSLATSRDYTQSITFATGDNSVTFDSVEIYKPHGLKDIFSAADILALNCETYADSNIVRPIGKLKTYKFDYHYVYGISGEAKFHGIIIHDTITSTEIYVMRFDKFIDNINIYK
jgi:hypothetical protein